MGLKKWTAGLSIILCLISIIGLFTYGLQWGLDFTGGTQIEVSYQKAADLQFIRETLHDADFTDIQVISYGTSKDVLISLPASGMDQTALVSKVMTLLPGATKKRAEFVGPQVGKELATKGVLAVIVALLATMIYIALRFEYRFSISAIVALVHDTILILGIFVFFHIEFDLKTLAAVLAVIGYSLNDTIVVFDRVRENFRKMRRASTIEIMNLSINQTFSRTVMTSALTLVVVMALFIYGGETIHGFALALSLGVIIGTYSSIYIAGVLAVYLGLDRKNLGSTSDKM